MTTHTEYSAPNSHRALMAAVGAAVFAFLYGVTAGAFVSMAYAAFTGASTFPALLFWAPLLTVTAAGALYGWRNP